MSATDTIKVGDHLPRVESVTAHDNWLVTVTWASGERKLVDLAPALFSYKLYKPLRENRDLFKSVHPIERGTAIAWGDDDAIDMAVTTIAHLAAEAMEPADFAEFLRRHKLTYDAAAAQLGISRRLVAYYASERQVPRYIALACAYLNDKLRKPEEASPQTEPSAHWWTGEGSAAVLVQTAAHVVERMTEQQDRYLFGQPVAWENKGAVRYYRMVFPAKEWAAGAGSYHLPKEQNLIFSSGRKPGRGS